MIVSGCTSSGTVGVQPAKPLPPDPLAAVKTDDPDGLLTMVATVGNAPGQQRTVTVSGKHMQLHGVCVGTGSMIIDANGSGGRQLCVRGVCGSGASGLGPRWLHHAAACCLPPARACAAASPVRGRGRSMPPAASVTLGAPANCATSEVIYPCAKP